MHAARAPLVFAGLFGGLAVLLGLLGYLGGFWRSGVVTESLALQPGKAVNSARGRNEPLLDPVRDPARVAPLPEVVPLPSLGQPLVFWHIPKCAGSTMEKHLWQTALSLNITFVKPCKTTGDPTHKGLGLDVVVGNKPAALPCGWSVKDATQCSADHKDAGLRRILRAYLACASMVVGHFRPVDLLPLWRRATPKKGQKFEEACDATGQKAFCERRTSAPTYFPFVRCITVLREPLARSLSHHYHFDYLGDNPKCQTWGCSLFSSLTVEQQIDILKGPNQAHLGWLAGGSKQSRTGKPIAQWVDEGWEQLIRGVVFFADRWADSAALFGKLLPWALPLTDTEMVQPDAKRRPKKNGTQSTGAGKGLRTKGRRLEEKKGLKDEMPMLVASGSLPSLCEVLAPDIFFYVRATTWFYRTLSKYGISPQAAESPHFCEDELRALKIDMESIIAECMTGPGVRAGDKPHPAELPGSSEAAKLAAPPSSRPAPASSPAGPRDVADQEALISDAIRARGWNTSVPEVVPVPSRLSPLIFWHIPKCAGSTMENHLWKSALARNISFVKPCPVTGAPTHGGVKLGAKSSQKDLHCGWTGAVAMDCNKTDTDAELRGVLRAHLACASMIIGHFRPVILMPLLDRSWADPARSAGDSECMAEGEKGFCLTSPSHRQPAPWPYTNIHVKCVTVLREPLARTLSHHYHFDYLGKEPTCKLWNCTLFSLLEQTHQIEILQRTGQAQLWWLVGDKVRKGKPVSQWVDDGWGQLIRGALFLADHWSDSAQLFRKLLPWALPIDPGEVVQPNTMKRKEGSARERQRRLQKRAPPQQGLSHELPALRRSGTLPALCEVLAPDIFFYIRATAWFYRTLKEYGISPVQAMERHFCEDEFLKSGISIESSVSFAMVHHR